MRDAAPEPEIRERDSPVEARAIRGPHVQPMLHRMIDHTDSDDEEEDTLQYGEEEANDAEQDECYATGIAQPPLRRFPHLLPHVQLGRADKGEI